MKRLLIAITVLAAWDLRAESICQNQKPLSLQQVLIAIKDHAQSADIAASVSAWHVGFTLDPNALDSLVAAGATETLLDLLDRDTISRLSLVQGRSEVAQLRQRMSENRISLNLEREMALNRLDKDFENTRKSAARLEPKDEFTTTAVYEERRKRLEQDLSAMDRKHESDQKRVIEMSDQSLRHKNLPFERRIHALENGLFIVPGATAVYMGYEADTSILTAGIIGEKFLFKITPDLAKSLHDKWATLEVREPYSEETSPEYYLSDADGTTRFEAQRETERSVLEHEPATTSDGTNSLGQQPLNGYTVSKDEVTSPVPTYKVDPEYTEQARVAKISGRVLVSLVVDENGQPRNIRILKSLDKGLDQKAIDAVRKWRFQPGTKDGRAVAVQTSIELNFVLLPSK